MRCRRRPQQIGTRVAAWWRAAVVAPVRRAWLAVARVRKGRTSAAAKSPSQARTGTGETEIQEQSMRCCEPGIRECGGKVLINLHQDVQTCGYQDVQVMWDMLSSDTAAAAGASTPKQRPFWPTSGTTTAVAQ